MSTEAPAAAPLTVPILNIKGESVGELTVDPADFGGTINKQLLHDVVVMHHNNQRAGTHSTKRRGEVAGSTKKLFRQKGTGNARIGTRRSNKRRGGGTAKGPKPRDYEYHLPRKAVRAATRMAILSKFQDHEAVIVDGLARDVLLDDNKAVKTKKMVGILKALKVDDKSCLIGTAGLDADLWRAARNLPRVAVAPAAEFNAYTVLRQKRLVLTRAAFDQLRQAGQAKA